MRGCGRRPRCGRRDPHYLYTWYWWDWFAYDDECHFVVEGIYRWGPNDRLMMRVPFWEWDTLDTLEQSRRINVFVNKVKPEQNGAPPLWEGVDSKWAEKYPAIHDYMTATHYGDGTPRVVATVNFFMGREGYTLVLQDRDVPRSLWASSSTVDGVWRALEQQAQKGEAAPWRADKRETGKTGRLQQRPS